MYEESNLPCISVSLIRLCMSVVDSRRDFLVTGVLCSPDGPKSVGQ